MGFHPRLEKHSTAARLGTTGKKPAARLGFLLFHCGGENSRRTGAHNTRIDVFALLQRGANLLSRNEYRFLVFMALHQIDAPDRFVIRGKADVERMNLQIAAQILENLLGVEIAPNRRQTARPRASAR